MRKLTNAIKNFFRKLSKRNRSSLSKSENAESFKELYNNYKK